MTWLASIPTPIWQAVVAGTFLATGWLVNGWQNRRDAAALRAERLRDVHRALYAEIGANLANIHSEARIDTYAQGMIERMRGKPDFVPFIPRERNDHVFDAIVANVHVLPRQTIDAIVAYYSQVKSIASLADDMRADGFARMSQDRRIAMYQDYIAMKKQALQFGNFAKAVIAAYAIGGADAANAEAARLNSPAAGRSVP